MRPLLYVPYMNAHPNMFKVQKAKKEIIRDKRERLCGFGLWPVHACVWVCMYDVGLHDVAYIMRAY